MCVKNTCKKERNVIDSHSVCGQSCNFATVTSNLITEHKIMTSLFNEALNNLERIMNMKKIVLTVVAVMSMTMAFAAGENDNNNTTTNANAYKFNVSTYALSRALNLNQDQIDMVEDVNRTFAAEMMNASVADSSEREAKVNEAIKKDLSYMRYILNNRQYREYVKFLNVTLNNRGLTK